jgi:protein arginine N-methyltransferase 1
VLDLGTGVGFFAVLACQFGARQVYAIETNRAIELGPQIAQANGCADRITFLKDLSTAVTLPERADVIVSDLRGTIPLFGHHIASIADARRRFLAPGGVLIPQRDRLYISMAEAPAAYARRSQPWVTNKYDVDMQAGWSHINNMMLTANLTPDDLLTEPYCWVELDYNSITQPNVSTIVEQTVERAGTAHGLRLWFEATLMDGVTYSNAPGSSVEIYNHLFLFFSEPVDVVPGDRLRVHLQASLVGDDYIWRWDADLSNAQSRKKANFRQSTFFSTPVSLTQLRKRATDHRPKLSGDGELLAAVLAWMKDDLTVGEIADRLLARYPDRFPSYQEALGLAGNLSAQYSD